MAKLVSTHSRLKAAGKSKTAEEIEEWVSTHSRLKAAGTKSATESAEVKFQHTAA